MYVYISNIVCNSNSYIRGKYLSGMLVPVHYSRFIYRVDRLTLTTQNLTRCNKILHSGVIQQCKNNQSCDTSLPIL